jgi:hypothetical protein
MSGGESRQTPLPKGQLRDCAESERQRKTHSPRTVTYILNRPLHAQTMHVFSRQDCILFCTTLSGRHMSHFTGAISFKNVATIMPSHHSNGTGGAHWMARLDLKAVCYVLTCTSKLKNSAVASKLSHHIEGADGTCWMTKPVEESQILEALCSHVRQDRSSSLRQDTASLRVCSSHGTNFKNPQLAPKLALYTEGIDGPLWITMPDEDMQAVEASYSYRGQDSTLTLTSRPTQAGLRSTHGNIAFSTLLSQLRQELKKGPALIVRGQDSTLTLTTSRSTQAGLRSSLGNIALPTLLSQLRQELKKGPALICITVYRHVVMYVGLTLKGQNRTATLTDISTQAIKPSGHSTALTLAFKIGAVRFLRSFSKLGWDLQQVFPTISKSKLIRVAPGEPFLPFPREGVG